MAAWTKDYFGSVKPTSDGFNLTSGDTDITNVRSFLDASWLEWDDDGTPTASRFEADTTTTDALWNVTNGTGWTIYAVVQVTANELVLTIDDGTYRHDITLQIGTVDMDSGAGGGTSSQDLQRPRTIRIRGVGTAWEAFIDEADTIIATLTASTASSGKLLRFGTNIANARVFLRELAWTADGAFKPTEFAAPSVVTTYATVQEVRQAIDIPQDAVSDSAVAAIIRRVETDIDEVVFGPDYTRTRLVFGAGGTETQEQQNWQGGALFRTRYPYITALTTVQYRTSSDTSNWSTLSESDIWGFLQSDRDAERGIIRIRTPYLRRAAAVRITYTWGLGAVPLAIKQLCILKASLLVYNAALQHGASDVFQQRRAALQDEINRKTDVLMSGHGAWRVTG